MGLPIATIYSKANLKTKLVDKRGGPTFRFRFGLIEDVARQYGVTMINMGEWTSFSAPKSKLQMFAEKLHFSKIPFTESIPKPKQ